jgi:hypothetical protein
MTERLGKRGSDSFLTVSAISGAAAGKRPVDGWQYARNRHPLKPGYPMCCCDSLWGVPAPPSTFWKDSDGP